MAMGATIRNFPKFSQIFYFDQNHLYWASSHMANLIEVVRKDHRGSVPGMHAIAPGNVVLIDCNLFRLEVGSSKLYETRTPG